MTYSSTSKIRNIAILTIGLLLGLLIIAKGQSMDHIKKISGQYIFDDQNIETSIKLDLNKDFFLPDENGINMSVSIHRLVDKINVIDVSNYFYEVSIKKEGQENLNTMNTMQVIHNSSNDQVLIDIAD